jgi:hypothetical protein
VGAPLCVAVEVGLGVDAGAPVRIGVADTGGTAIGNRRQTTPVRIVSHNSEGAHVEVAGGPDKGSAGFVAKDAFS